MVKRFFKDSAIYAGAGALSQGISFILFPFLAHVFSPNDYGAIDVLGLISTIAYLTVALEVNQGLGRYFAEAPDEEERVRLSSTALIFSAGAYGLFALVTLPLAGPITSAVLHNKVGPWVTRIAILAIVVAGVLYVAQDQLRWRMRQRAYAFVSVTLAFVTTSVTAVLVLGFRVGVLGALVGQLCGACAAAIAVVALSRGAYRPVFDPERCRRMLSFSMPLVPASAGVFLNNFADRYAVLQTRSLNAVGVYGVGFRISAAVTLLLLGFQGAATPLITARHGEESTREELARIFRIFVTMALALFVALSLFADALVHVLASSAYAGADTVVPYLTMGALLFGGYVFAPGLWLSRRTKLSAGIAVIAGLLNLGLALALTPSLGIRGAGIATAVSSGVFLVPTLVLSQRFYAVPHQWLRLVAALALAIAVVVAGRALLPVGGVHAVALAPLAEKAAVTLAAMAALAALVLQRAEIAGIAGVLRRRAGSGAGGAAQGAVDEVEHDR